MFYNKYTPCSFEGGSCVLGRNVRRHRASSCLEVGDEGRHRVPPLCLEAQDVGRHQVSPACVVIVCRHRI